MALSPVEASKLYTRISLDGISVWRVECVLEAGDMHPFYIVRRVGGTHGQPFAYTCTCQNSGAIPGGICRHILAVARWCAENPVPPAYSPVFQDNLTPPISWLKSLRAHQWQAVQEIVRLFDEGKKVVIVEAPTGSGKTLIGELVRRAMKVKGIYLCTTIQLQNQFMRDFSYAALIKGRSNYPTLDYPEKFGPPEHLSCADCDKQKINDEESVCSWCSETWKCPYQVAKREAAKAPLVVGNVAYWIAESNHGPKTFANRPLVIIDEADELEHIIMSAVEVRVGPRQLQSLGIGTPEKKTVPTSWDEWVNETAIPAVTQKMEMLAGMIDELPSGPARLRYVRELRGFENVLGGLKRVSQGKVADGNWVYSPDQNDGAVVFKPIRVAEDAKRLVWPHGERFLLMSGTICAPDIYAEELGFEKGEWGFVAVPSTFPRENRPVYVTPRATMTRKTKDSELLALIAGIDDILDRYPTERALIHAVSYDLAAAIMEGSRHRFRMITYKSAKERFEALSRFEQTPAAVMVAPSMERGIDLRGDLCRCVIIAKVPYPNLGDKQVNARLYSKGGQAWYNLQTVRTIVQMCGRGVRSADDYCDTYIVDRQFMEFRKKAWRLFPAWWREAVVWSDKPKANPIHNLQGGIVNHVCG